MYVNKTEICKLKANNNISWNNFCFGSISNDFTKGEQSEIFLNGTVYDFPVDHSSSRKENILNIHQYLMVKYNVILFGFTKKMFIGLLSSIVNAFNHTKYVS